MTVPLYLAIWKITNLECGLRRAQSSRGLTPLFTGSRPLFRKEKRGLDLRLPPDKKTGQAIRLAL